MYDKEATSRTPALVIYLLDISGSMAISLEGKKRVDFVSEAIEGLTQEMLFRSMKGNVIRPRYRIAMFAYSDEVYDVLDGVKTIDVVADKGTPEFQADGNTYTAKAFEKAEQLLARELPQIQECPAPLVCHITDGEYSRGSDPSPVAQRIRNMGNKDGKVLIENVFISNRILANPIPDLSVWPGISRSDLALDNPEGQYAAILMDISSPLPETYATQLRTRGYAFETGRPMMVPGISQKLVTAALSMAGTTGIVRTPSMPERPGE